MKQVLVPIELLEEIKSGLIAYGKEATEMTLKKLETVMKEGVNDEHIRANFRIICREAKSLQDAQILAFDAFNNLRL